MQYARRPRRRPFGPVALQAVRKTPGRKPQESIGDHVRERRLALGLTQAEAAKRIGLTRDGLAKWETGRCERGYALMPAVISFLDYNLELSAQTFGDLIKSARRQLGLNQRQLSRACDVSFDSLRLWEQGTRPQGQGRARTHRGHRG
ncbi:MAG: helix-turn-helix domain-containing protein [Caulobacterales bacterium]